MENKEKSLHKNDINRYFQSDVSNIESDLLLTVNGSVLGKYTKKEVEQRLVNTLNQLKKLKKHIQ